MCEVLVESLRLLYHIFTGCGLSDFPVLFGVSNEPVDFASQGFIFVYKIIRGRIRKVNFAD